MSSSEKSSFDVVDVHAHLVPESLLADLAAGRECFPNVRVVKEQAGFVVTFCDEFSTRPVARGLIDAGLRRDWLSANDVSHQVAGTWLDIVGDRLPAAEGEAWAELLTQRIQAEVADDPRLIGLASLPMQDPVRAAESLRKHRSNGIRGAMIGTHAAGIELDDAAYTPLWEAAHETAAVLFVHPGYGTASSRYADFGLVNGLGRVEDITVTVARLLYAGIPARYPDAAIVASHGGGAIAAVLGRLIQNHMLNSTATADPVESLHQLYVDSVVFDADAFALVTAKLGADRILLGTDYPFPIGDLRPRDLIESVDVDDAVRKKIMAGTARELFMAEG